ncbi:MAG: peptide chain release factor 1 [Gammaproteobacteria bacterium]|nr:peptide chain release factor 1 [Gammaproteobacteria bacterium]
MEARLLERVRQLADRAREVARELSEPETANDSNRLTRLSREYNRLEPATRALEEYERLGAEFAETEQLDDDGDPELVRLATEERRRIQARRQALEDELIEALLPADEDEHRSLFLEIRAGTGGDEAALFAGDLLRMYARYAEARAWRLEIVSASEGEVGGFKEVIARVAGDGAWSKLKFESGTHRVQRVPRTESQGRIHTSACTIAVLPEVETADEVEIHPVDLRVDTYRASGAGGQHVNRTDSAVRITHLPTGLVVECQDERSQHQNRARAMSLLQSRLLAAERDRQTAERASSRRLQVGSGDRSERIRTYNFPQGRVTDHRVGLTLYQLEQVLDGSLDLVLEPLAAAAREDALAELAGQT